MTEVERTTMLRHVEYWKPFVDNGTVIVLGPVMDPTGAYGIAVVAVETEEELKGLIADDPANGLNTYEWYPMRAVTKSTTQ
jgi:uncharacterized protein